MRKITKISLFSLVIIVGFLFGATLCYAYNLQYRDGFDPEPAYLTCYSGFTSDFKAAVHNANLQWNSAGQGDIVYRTTFDCSTTEPGLMNNKNEITKGRRGTWNYCMGASRTQTLLTAITEADIDVNLDYLWAYDGSDDKLDVGDNITHEIGHVLGLGHSSSSTATMWDTSADGQTFRRTLAQDDKNGICARY